MSAGGRGGGSEPGGLRASLFFALILVAAAGAFAAGYQLGLSHRDAAGPVESAGRAVDDAASSLQQGLRQLYEELGEALGGE